MIESKTKRKHRADYLDINENATFFYIIVIGVLINGITTYINYYLFFNQPKIQDMDIINNIIAPIIVGLLTASAGWLWSLRKLRGKIDAAPRKYVQELDDLINKAIEEGEENALINARAIVSTRNSLRSSLVSISQHLNSEIDRLAKDIGQNIPIPLEPSIPNPDATSVDAKKAFDTIKVLSKIWPAKKVQIEYEIKKLLAELNLP